METDAERVSRSDAIVRAAWGLGAIFGLGIAGPFVNRALAANGHGDVAVLNFLLKFEYIEVVLYEAAQRRLKPTGDLKTLVETLGAEEQQHADWLIKQVGELGGKPVAKLSYEYLRRRMPVPAITTAKFLRLAHEIEEAVVAAYNGAIPRIESKELRAELASIAQVEGRHTAAVRIQRNEEPSPEAFDSANNEFDALSSVERFAGPEIYE